MMTMLKICVVICQLCGIFLILCMMFRGTRFERKVHGWMEKHKNVTAVFAVMAMLGIVLSIISSRF